MKYILSHLTLKKQIDLINLKGTLRQYTLWVLSHISSESKQFQKSILIWFFFQCIGRSKGRVCNLRRYIFSIWSHSNNEPNPSPSTFYFMLTSLGIVICFIFFQDRNWKYHLRLPHLYVIEKHLFVFDENSLKVATETRLGGPHLEAQVLEYFS